MTHKQRTKLIQRLTNDYFINLGCLMKARKRAVSRVGYIIEVNKMRVNPKQMKALHIGK